LLVVGVLHRGVTAVLEPMRERSPVPAFHQPVRNVARRGGDQPLDCQRVGIAELVDHVHQLGVFRRGVGADDVPKCRRFWRWRLRIESRDVERGEIGSDVLEAAGVVPVPKLVPVRSR